MNNGNALTLYEKIPDLPSIPSYLYGVDSPSVCLTNRTYGEWQFLFEEIEDIPSPYSENQNYDFSNTDSGKWVSAAAPGSLIMQGFDIKNNKEYYYRKIIEIPDNYKNQNIHLRFEGVYSNARVWVNGVYLKTHIGGFTEWDCDLSSFSSLNKVELIIGVSDIEGTGKGAWNPEGKELGNSSWASFYAHHNIGGILRNITLYCLPCEYISSIRTETDADGNKAKLKIQLNAHSVNNKFKIKFELFNKQGESVFSKCALPVKKGKNEILSFTPDKKWIKKHKKAYENDCKYQKLYIQENVEKPEDDILFYICDEIEIQNPVLWDAEHPYLYNLEISVIRGDSLVVSTSCINIGFREILYGGKKSTDKNKLYVNGKEIKLRGVCRHDVSHLYGRSLTYDDMLKEIKAYKKNNINHIRTSHYPPDNEILNLCDRLGIYVEVENSACFKGANDVKITNAPQDFLDTFSEMVESARNHPSVIIWSLANESGFEQSFAFRSEYNFIKERDNTRPVIFSYPHLVHSKPLPYDILSKHYKKVTSNLGKKNMPLLHDEFAHVSCYNIDQLKKGDGVRAFWGESIKKGWDNIFNTDGALGCAVWAAIDDVFYLPVGTISRHQTHGTGDAVGYGEWGCILDAFKREKPEAFLTKKAFSPFYVENIKEDLNKISLNVYNRFDHTNISEGSYICKNKNGKEIFSKKIKDDIPPHTKGKIIISDYPQETSQISFNYAGCEVESITLKDAEKRNCKLQNIKRILYYCVSCNDFLMLESEDQSFLSKVQFEYCGVNLKIEIKEASKNKLTAVLKQRRSAAFKLNIQTENQLMKFLIRPVGLKAKMSLGSTFNIKFGLNTTVQSVSWQKKSLYKTYPKTHIDREAGTAVRLEKENIHPVLYGEAPKCTWEKDTENYFLYKKDSEQNFNASRDFRSMRTCVNWFSAEINENDTLGININSENTSVHMLTDNAKKDFICLSKGAYFPDLQWGNYYGARKAFRSKDDISFSIALGEKTEDDNEQKY